MSQIAIQLVCFDLGGVFLRLSNGWKDAVHRAGLDLSAMNSSFDRDPGFIDLNHRFERGQIEEFDYAKQAAAITGFSPDSVLAALDAWLLEPYPGIDALLDRLESCGVQTACLSNTNHAHWRVVTTPGPRFLPLHRLDHRFASPLVGHRKPEPAIYQHVQEQTGVHPQSILFFDDDTHNIQMAIQQGWCAHQIDPHANPVAQAIEHLQRYDVLT